MHMFILTKYSTFLVRVLPRESNYVLDVYTGKAVWNKKCKHGLGRIFFTYFFLSSELLLHPTSSRFQFRTTYINYNIKLIYHIE